MQGEDVEQFAQWIGRTEVVEDLIAPMPARMLAAMLDHDDPAPRDGDAIPPLGHWTQLIPTHRLSEIADDGHARRGPFMPPVSLPRRMYAGGRIEFLKPIRVGERARRTGRITDIVSKKGRTGDLVFVSVRQEIETGAGLALVEEQDIVYRGHPGKDSSPPAQNEPAVRDAQHVRRYLPNEAMLFQYSALIFNAHRIHYDRPYATEVENYPGLVVHGQLVATCLADLALRNWPRPMTAFSFRAKRPLFDGSPFTVNGAEDGEALTLWATDDTGQITMEAEARF